jgi:agmatinase
MADRGNFCGIPRKYADLKNSRVVIIPVPYDRTSTWLKGADKGPAAIIAASENMELYDIETDCEIYKVGVHTDRPVTEKSSPQRMVRAVCNRVRSHIKKKKFVVVLGGEHSVSIGAAEAHIGQYQRVTVLQLDAHTDLRQEYLGSKYNHACVMARIRQMCPIVQVGIRSTAGEQEERLDRKRIFFAEDIYDSRAWISKVVARLSPNVYITLDLDVFDPSIMPSTGTPEPGGLLWYDVLKLLKTVCSRRNVIGFDVVELCPRETNKSPDFLAAKLIYKLLSYRFKGIAGS